MLGQSREGHNTHYSGSDMRSSVGGSPWEDKEGNGGQEGYVPTSCQLQLPGRIEHGMRGDGSNQNPAEETSLCPQTPLWNSPSALHVHVSQSYSHPAQTRRHRRGCSNSDEAPWGTHTENKPFVRDWSRMFRSNESGVMSMLYATCMRLKEQFTTKWFQWFALNFSSRVRQVLNK